MDRRLRDRRVRARASLHRNVKWGDVPDATESTDSEPEHVVPPRRASKPKKAKPAPKQKKRKASTATVPFPDDGDEEDEFDDEPAHSPRRRAVAPPALPRELGGVDASFDDDGDDDVIDPADEDYEDEYVPPSSFRMPKLRVVPDDDDVACLSLLPQQVRAVLFL